MAPEAAGSQGGFATTRAALDYPRPRLGALIGGAVLIALLYYGRDVLAPCALAVLLAFLLDPLVTRLRRIGASQGLAVALALSLTMTALAAASWLVVRQVTALGRDLPAYQTTIYSKLRGMTRLTAESTVVGDASRVIDAVSAELDSARREAKAAKSTTPTVAPQPVVLDETPESVWESTKARVMSALGALTMAGIVVLILVLVLLQRNDLRDRLIRLAGDDLHLTTDAMDEVALRVGRYLRTQLLINVLYGVPMAAGLFLIGVPGALMWGMLAALLRFVPYVGPAIAAMFPLVLSAAVDPGWTMLLWTALLVVTLELVSNNVVEPWLYGASTGLSALAIVVSTIFWTALWGPIGLVLSTPMTVCLAVIGRHVPQWAWLDVLLGNAQPIDDATRLHQRLLAGDVEDAIELASRSIESSGVSDFYSDAAVPALRQAVQSYANAARVEHRYRVNSGMSTLVRTLREEFQGAKEPHKQRVLCLGARWEVDALAAEMLAHALTMEGIPARALAITTGANDDIGHLDVGDADTVCLSLFSPSPDAKVRYIARRLKRHRPDLRVLAAMWNAPASLTGPDAAATLGVDGTALSLREAVQRVAAWSPGAAAAEVEGQTAGIGDAPPVPTRAIAPDQAADLRSHLLRSAQHVAEVFDVSLTVVTVTDPAVQVWFDRAQAGAGTETGPLPPCCDALNAAVLADGGTLSSEDLARDPRFADAAVATPVVAAERLRFFAGTPLEFASGQVVGTLCLYDRVPRALGNDELALLGTMGREMVAPWEAAAAEGRRPTPRIASSTQGPWQPDTATS